MKAVCQKGKKNERESIGIVAREKKHPENIVADIEQGMEESLMQLICENTMRKRENKHWIFLEENAKDADMMSLNAH